MRVYQLMHAPAIALWFTGCARMYVDGDQLDVVYRWWHPVTLALIVIMLIPCALLGERLFDTVPVCLPRHLDFHRHDLTWVTPFSKYPQPKGTRHGRKRTN